MTIHKFAFQRNPDLKLSCIHGMNQLIKANKLTQENAWAVNAYANAVCTPLALAELIRTLFVELPEERAYRWAILHLEAIPVGADLSQIWPNFLQWLINNPENGIKKYISDKHISDLFEKVLTAYESVEPAENFNEIIQLSEQYMSDLTVENDAANRKLYALAMVRSLARGHIIHFFENFKAFLSSLNIDPEEARKAFEKEDKIDNYWTELTGETAKKVQKTARFDTYDQYLEAICNQLLIQFSELEIKNT